MLYASNKTTHDFFYFKIYFVDKNSNLHLKKI